MDEAISVINVHGISLHYSDDTKNNLTLETNYKFYLELLTIYSKK